MRAAGIREASRVDTALPLLAVLLSTVVILAPLWRPGYVLAYDMVFVPHQPITAELFGLGSQAPRAVPSDLVVAALSHVVPGQVVQKLLLTAVLVAAGCGIMRLVPLGAVGRTAAVLAYLWSPFVAQRLLIGHWPVLIGYAALPWLVRAGFAVRAGRAGAWPRFALIALLCCLGGPPAWLLAAISAPWPVLWGGAVQVGSERWFGRLAGLIAVLVVWALPWAVPALLRPGSYGTSRIGADVFAARADTRLGVVGSVLAGGGGWNRNTDLPGRDSLIYAFGVIVFLVLVGVGMFAMRTARTVLLGPLAIGAAIALVIALGSAVGPFRSLTSELPGGGLLRDAARFTPAWILLASVAFGFGVQTVAQRLPASSEARQMLAGALAVLPVAMLPGLAWGASGRLVPVAYPADYQRVASAVNDDPRNGAVLVLPAQPYRRFPWNGNRVSLDPTPRWLDRTVIWSTDLPVVVDGKQQIVRGEDRLAADVFAALGSGADTAKTLGQFGVRWVVVDSQPAGVDLSGLRRLKTGPNLSLYEVDNVDEGRATRPTHGYAPPTGPVIAADALAAATALGILVGWAFTARVRVLESGTRATVE